MNYNFKSFANKDETSEHSQSQCDWKCISTGCSVNKTLSSLWAACADVSMDRTSWPGESERFLQHTAPGTARTPAVTTDCNSSNTCTIWPRDMCTYEFSQLLEKWLHGTYNSFCVVCLPCVRLSYCAFLENEKETTGSEEWFTQKWKWWTLN